MAAFNVDELDFEVWTTYEYLRRRGVNQRSCLVCGRAVTFNEFNELVESGRHEVNHLIAILEYGTHPECWEGIFSESERDT